MPSTADIFLDTKIKCLVFGRFKQGKTWGALTFPRPNFIDFDGGIITVLNPQFVAKYGLRQIQYFQPHRNLDSKGVPQDYNALDEACRYFDDWMKPAKRDLFDSWVLDSATTLIDASSDKAIILLGGTGFAGSKSSTLDEAKKYGLVSPKLQDFGAERSMTEQFVRMLVDSGKHVVVLAHEREQTDKAGNTTAIVPLLTGKSQEDIPIMFHEVYRLVARPFGEGVVRELKTQPFGGAKVGSRLGVPDNTPWDFDTLNKIISDIRAGQQKLLAEAKHPQPAASLKPAGV